MRSLTIRKGYNPGLMKACPLLGQYAEYVECVQRYAAEQPLAEAVEKAVKECIREGILSDFLLRNRAEAIAVSIFEYDEEKEMALLREAEREIGRDEGKVEGIRLLVTTCHELGISFEDAFAKLKEKYILDEDQAKRYMQQYW